MRVFISVELPDYVKKTCINIQQQLQQLEAFSGNFVPLNQLHITLIFFADVSVAQLNDIQQALNKFEFKEFEITLGDVEIVSDRLIWISVPDKVLVALYESLKVVLTGIVSWKDQEKPFKGHITLVRIKQLDNARALISCVRNLEYVKDFFMVDKICLKLSTLSDEGSEHSIIECYQGKG